MKHSIYIALILACFTSAGQAPQIKSETPESEYKRIKELTLVEILDSSIISGNYLAPVGFDDGAALDLREDGKFLEFIRRERIDSGTWTIEGKQLILKNLVRNGIFDVVKYDRYLFLVPISSRKDFVKEFVRSLNSTKKNKDAEPSFSYWVVKGMRIIFYHKPLK